MDVLKFLQQGNVSKNPDYNPKTKEGAKQAPFLVDYDAGASVQDKMTELLAANLNRNTTDLSKYADSYKNYADYNTYVNAFDNEEELNKERAQNQGWIEQTGHALTQSIVNEVILGSALGFSNIIDAGYNLLDNIARKVSGSDESKVNDYTNTVSKWLEGIQDEVTKRFDIYQENPGDTWSIGDFGWWASNMVSVASTASMLIPSTATVKGLSLIGKAAKLNKLSYGAAKALRGVGVTNKSAARLAKSINVGTEIGTSAFLNRTMENYLEARGVYNEVYENSLERLKQLNPEQRSKMIERNPKMEGMTDEEMASYIAGKGADETFINDYAMLLMDIAQFKAIGSLWKGNGSKAATAALRRENKASVRGLVGETTDNAATAAEKNIWLKDRIDAIKHGLQHPATSIAAVEWSEGIEEGYQGIQTEKGKEVAEMILNPEFIPRTIGSYLFDPAIWEQAFWGVIGGVGFQVAGKALGNAYRKSYAKLNKDNLSEEDFALNMTAEEKVRSAEIKGRATMNQKFIDDMQLINNLQSPYEYEQDADGKRKVVDGVEIRRSLTLEEAESQKAITVNRYVTQLSVNATRAGNYDLLKEYVTSPEFDKYFQQAGIGVNSNFTQQVIEKMDAARNSYENALRNVLTNTEVENESVAHIVAQDIAMGDLSIDSLIEQSNEINDNINNSSDTQENIDAYKRQAIKQYVTRETKILDDAQQAMYDVYEEGKISEQAKNEYEREYNHKRNVLTGMLRDYIPFNEDVTKQIKSLYEIEGAEQTMIALQQTLDIINSIYTDEQQGGATKATKELIDRQIALEYDRRNLELVKPKTQEQYEQRVNDVSQQVDLLTIKRFNDAAKAVEQYIIGQEDMAKAIDDVIRGNVPELKEANDILKLGYYGTKEYFDSIISTVREEQRKRAKQENAKNESTVDGNKGSEQTTNTVRNGIESTNNAAENNNSKEQNKSEPNPSTGEGTQGNITSVINITNTTNYNPIQTTETANTPTTSPVEGNPFVTREDIEGLNTAAKEAAKTDAAKVAKAFELTIDDEAIGRASSATFEIFRTSRNVFDDALGKDFNSPEVKNLINLVTERLLDQGVSVGFAPAAARRGVSSALNTMARILKNKKDTKAEQFKALADMVASKQDFMAANTTTIPDGKLNETIDKLIEVYSELKSVATPKGQKTIINLDRLFNEIIYNQDIDIDTAMMILYNMRDYINNSGKYIFTARNSLNSMLKNPSVFFESVSNARLQERQLDNYMHISPSSQRDGNYDSRVASLTGNEEVEVEYLPDRSGNKNSISFKIDGKEIGFVATVTPNAANTGYTTFISKYAGGIKYNISFINESYTSNTDALFDEVFNQDGELWEILNKHRRYINNPVGNRRPTDAEYEKIANNTAVRQAIISEIIIMPQVFDTKTRQFKQKFTHPKDRGMFITNLLQGVAFYDVEAQSEDEYRYSYEQWIKNAYTNYENTHKIQLVLDKGGKVITKFAGRANTYMNGQNDVRSIITEQERGISDLPLTFDKNPIVVVTNSENGANLVNEGTGKTVVSKAPFKVGSMGMWIGGREETPILAMFTSANRLGAEMKQNLKNELTNILTGFQDGRYSFEEVDRKLSALFNGPGINNPTIFQGYSVVHNGNNVGLAVGGEISKYVLVVNKFKKGTTENGTGISYAPNGDLNKATSSISVNKQFISKIVDEVANNVVYNKTFFTINNLGIDNVTTNPYMQKVNGKFVIKLGNVTKTYENFGDFVLKENAFNTNQGTNVDGGFFDNSEKVNSLYVDVAVLTKPDSKTSPVDGLVLSPADIIRTGTIAAENFTTDLLIAAGFTEDQANFFTGTNEFDIPIIPANYGYDANTKGANALYRNGKILFTEEGVRYISGIRTTTGGNNSIRRLLIHEQIHAQVNKHKVFDRTGLIEDLLDTYNATVEAVNEVLKTVDKNSVEYNEAARIKKWIEENSFTLEDYFTKLDRENHVERTDKEKARIFAEEWLAESLSQSAIMEFMNKTQYKGKEVSIAGIANENKSIWQKLIDLLLKIFNINNGNIKDNTIFAQQYLILGNINNAVENTNNTKEEQKVTNPVAGEDTTKTEEKTPVEEVITEFNEDIPESLNADESIETETVEEDSLLDESLNEDADSDLLANTLSVDEVLLDHAANDGDAIAETLGITRIANMENYLDMFAEKDKPLVSRMLDRGEVKFACR